MLKLTMKTVQAALFGGVLSAMIPAAQAQQNFVVADNGGPIEAAIKKHVVPDFEKANNVKVVFTQGASMALLTKVQSQRDNPQIDVVMLDDQPFFQGITLGVWEPLSNKDVNASADLLPVAHSGQGFGFAYGVSATGIYYNKEIFQQQGWAPPTSWKDLLRPELAKKVTAHAITNTHGMNLFMSVTKMEGGSLPDKTEPGFQFMKKLAQNVLTFDKLSDTVNLAQQRASVIGTWSMNHTFDLKARGVPVEFVFPKEGVYGFRPMIAAVKGRPPESIALAKKFIAAILSRKQQENICKDVGFLSVDRTVNNPTQAEAVLHVEFPDAAMIAKHRAEWTDRWNKEVATR
jgi:putative spermidine/putrescine transport system substrate-binding protein